MKSKSKEGSDFGWQSCAEDIEIVLKNNGKVDAKILAKEIFSELNDNDFARIAQSALWGDEMEEQANYADEEIKAILVEKGHIV